MNAECGVELRMMSWEDKVSSELPEVTAVKSKDIPSCLTGHVGTFFIEKLGGFEE